MSAIALAKRAVAEVTGLLVPRVCLACGLATPAESPELCGSCGWMLSGVIGGDYCQSCGKDYGHFLLVDGRCSACRMREQAFDIVSLSAQASTPASFGV